MGVVKRIQKEAGKHAETVALLKQYTGCQDIRLVQRGNAAILCALTIAKKVNPKSFLLVPAEGGWISFKTYPKLLGFDVQTVKTNRGVIDLVDLEKHVAECAALILTSYGGYFAEQPMEYIYNICNRNGCLVIEDASGAIGDQTLAKSDYADIILGSFGKYKPIGNGYGGFIGARQAHLEKISDMLSTTNFFPDYDDLLALLKTAPKRYKKHFELVNEVKNDLIGQDFRVLHPDERGLNVVVRCIKPDDKERLIKYCERKNYAYVLCPDYNRVDEDAVSIELKRVIS